MNNLYPLNLPQARDAIIILGFIAVDIVSGLAKSMALHNYTSEIMRKGLFHKLAEIIAFGFGILADLTFPVIGVQLPVSIARSIAVYLVIMESGSITENLGQMNPDLAKYLSNIFAKVKPPETMKPPDDEPEEIQNEVNDEIN